MNRMRWLVTGLCVAGAATSIWGFSWFSDKLYPRVNAGEVAYKPEGMPPAVDMVSVQRDWPASLDEPGTGSRVIAYRHDMRGKAPAPGSAGGAAPAAVPVPDLGTLLASANAGAGKDKARVCMSCHDFTQGGPNRIGPNLWGVVGRKVATEAGFAYSSAMAGHGGTWTPETLFTYLASPARMVPGTKMSFAGMRRPEDRAAVIKYLESLGH
jgi:cytochrome c